MMHHCRLFEQVDFPKVYSRSVRQAIKRGNSGWCPTSVGVNTTCINWKVS